MRPRRSFIFAPGIRPDMFPKALKSGADMVCVDLEDAIAPQHKDEARQKTLAMFAEYDGDGAVEAIVRLNCLRTPDGMTDLRAVLESAKPPPALMLPKIKSPDEVRLIDEMLGEHDQDCRLHVIIETNDGLQAAYEIARASDRIQALFFGGVDMAADLRCQNSWQALLFARARIVHAAAGANVDVIDVPYLDLDDLDGMRREAEQCAEMGFSGKGAIHPKQIPTLNQVFTPDEATVAYARKIVDAFAAADTGLVVVDGKLIEKPVLRTMNRILATADRGTA
ncbi:MAG: CoA ester lyase [Alphaproteobacteria bacterium]|nr:CoA ester lyase [Alphaproteobacteria bacterium]